MRVAPYSILLLGILGGCTTQEISRNFYDGIENRNKTVRSMPPQESSGSALTYDEYERERKRIKNQD